MHNPDSFSPEQSIDSAPDFSEIKKEVNELTKDVIKKNDIVKSTHTLEKIRTGSESEKKFWQTVLIWDLTWVNTLKYETTPLPQWVTLWGNKKYISFQDWKSSKNIWVRNTEETFISEIIDSKQDNKTLSSMTLQEKVDLQRETQDLIEELTTQYTDIKQKQLDAEQQIHQHKTKAGTWKKIAVAMNFSKYEWEKERKRNRIEAKKMLNDINKLKKFVSKLETSDNSA